MGWDRLEPRPPEVDTSGMTSASKRTWLGLLVVIFVLVAVGITFYVMNRPDCRFDDSPRCRQPAFSQESTTYAGY